MSWKQTKRASVVLLSLMLTASMISPASIAKVKAPGLSSKSVSLSVKESATVTIKSIKKKNIKKLTVSVKDKRIVKASVDGKDISKSITLTGKKAGITIIYVKIKADKVYKIDLLVNVADEIKPIKADREGFAIWPITDELFYRMQQGNTYKKDCIVPREDLCYQLFIEKGFEWGGDWTDRKDYQHFELPTSVTDEYAEKYQSALNV